MASADLVASPELAGQLTNQPVTFANNVVRRPALISTNVGTPMCLFVVLSADVCGLLQLWLMRITERVRPASKRAPIVFL